ncbi:MAG: zinc ribbon domain-containing protein, partial [Peptococcaceae bacterium]|nr:zinc ribbon domain-containing protein [Peptococcaceae bacterium]
MFCEKCGTQFDDAENFCSACGAPNPAKQSARQPAQTGAAGTRPGGSGDGRVGGGVSPVLAKGEKVIKTYHCSQLRFPSCDGYLSVTNRRVIFHGYSGGGGSRIVDEVQLDSVSGLSTFYGGKFKVAQLVAALIMACVSIWILIQSAGDPLSWLAGILLVVAVILLVTCYRKMFFLKVYSSNANGSPIAIGEGYGGFGGNGAVFTVTASPTVETDAMMLELGALVSDLQR